MLFCLEVAMLYVCPTPIGNLGDITLRVLETLKTVDLVAAEDTRRTRALLSNFEISKPLVSFFEHNELKRLPELVQKLKQGEDIALVSDAGMPGISDPGYTLVKAALDEDIPVEVLPGPSSIETALVSSGFATDSFLFVGYLPRKKGELRKVLAEISAQNRSCVAFVSPQRLAETLTEAETALGMREVAVCRELTKKFAEIIRGTPSEVLAKLPDTVKGEIVLVFAQPSATPFPVDEEEALEEAIDQLLAEGLSPKRVTELVSYFTGAPKNKVYELTLERKEVQPD